MKILSLAISRRLKAHITRTPPIALQSYSNMFVKWIFYPWAVLQSWALRRPASQGTRRNGPLRPTRQFHSASCWVDIPKTTSIHPCEMKMVIQSIQPDTFGLLSHCFALPSNFKKKIRVRRPKCEANPLSIVLWCVLLLMTTMTNNDLNERMNTQTDHGFFQPFFCFYLAARDFRWTNQLFAGFLSAGSVTACTCSSLFIFFCDGHNILLSLKAMNGVAHL